MWDRLQKMIDKFNEAPHPFKLSMSVGMAQLEINESLDSLISRADQEMYVQKRLKKNIVDA
jgi:GGDEF domain-containing protein